MKLTKLHLIIILALTLILCPILGVCNNTRESFEQSQYQYMNEGFEIEGKKEGFEKVEEGFEEVEEGFEEEEGFEGFAEGVEEGFDEEEEGYQQYQD